MSEDWASGPPVVEAPPAADLAALLDDLVRLLQRFVWFPTEAAATACALWVAHVYAIEAAPAAAYLRIKSAAEESGKTTLLEVLAALLRDRAVNSYSASPAAVFRLRDKEGPVALLLDEVDNVLRDRKDDGARDLLALVNAGYRRSATVIRCVGNTYEPRRFSCWGPAAITGIGQLHPTTESRCIPIMLDRKGRQTCERWLPHLVAQEVGRLADRLAAWATESVVRTLGDARPEIPAGLRDRHVEGWWGMWAIADLAGGEWPRRARDSALTLHLGEDPEASMSAGVRLLSDVRDCFNQDGADRLRTRDLLARLVEREGAPWAKWWGREVDAASESAPPRAAASDLARYLRPWARPRVLRMPDGTTPRGYLRADFEDAWERYHPALSIGGATDATDATPLASPVASVASVAGGMGDGLRRAEEDGADHDEMARAVGNVLEAFPGSAIVEPSPEQAAM